MKFTNLAFIGLWFVNGLLSAQTQPDALIADGNNKVTQRPTAVFEENKGQMKDQYWQPRPDVLYYGNSGGMNYYIRNNGMSYQLSRVDCWKDAEDQKQLLGETKKQVPAEISTYRVDADWLGHNTDFTVAKGCELAGYNNYYNVPEGIEPALFVKQYEAVTLQNLWNGVDVHYYGTDGQLETDYLVAPSADYRQIRMEIKGAEISLSNNGHLVMKTPFGEIHEGSLKVYQGDQQVAANWIIMGNVVSFDIPNYDPCLALRIDPIVRVWGTYYGGDNSDYGGGALGLDSYNNVYMAGTALSINNIASGGHQNASEGDIEAFLVKFNSAGVRLWATYYGGYYDEIGYSCTVDINDNVYLCGGTGSDYNIATPGSHKEIFNAGGATYAGEAFLAKFNSSGIREWGTYFGGTSNDAALSCASDALGNIYLSGYTLSSDYIAFSGHQNTYSSGRDAFLAKFNASGGLLWASYYGGTGDDLGSFCKTDANNNVYM